MLPCSTSTLIGRGTWRIDNVDRLFPTVAGRRVRLESAALAALAAAERAGVIGTVLHAVRNVHVGVAPAAVTDNVVVTEDGAQRAQRTRRMRPEAYHQDGFTPAAVSVGPS